MISVSSFAVFMYNNTKTKGDISEAVVAAELLKLGFSISKPFGDNQPYDLIVDTKSKLLKVQIKTASIRNNCVMFKVSGSINPRLDKRKNFNYSGLADLIIAYCPEIDKCYVLSDFNLKAQVMLRLTQTKNRQEKNIRWAADYELTSSLIG
jgi:hypothetical protein